MQPTKMVMCSELQDSIRGIIWVNKPTFIFKELLKFFKEIFKLNSQKKLNDLKSIIDERVRMLDKFDLEKDQVKM